MNRLKLLKTGLASAILMATNSVLAAVPTAASDAITAAGTDAGSMIDLMWVPIASITGGFVLIKIFKRGSSKI